MGGYLSSPNQTTTTAHCFELVLHALAVLRQLSGELEANYDLRDARRGFLVNISAGATILDSHLRNAEEGGRQDLVAAPVRRLASILEEVFDDSLAETTYLKIPEKPPYPRLQALLKLVPTVEGSNIHLDKLQLVSNIRPRTAWEQLQSSLAELSDELGAFGEDAPGITAPQLGDNLPCPSTDDGLKTFQDLAFASLSCDKCAAGPRRDVKLRIGTYKRRRLSDEARQLCLLFARDSHNKGWHEALFHDLQNTRSPVKKIRFAEVEAGPGEAWRTDSPKSYNCTCSLLRSHSDSLSEFWRLNVALDAAGIHNHIPDERAYKHGSLQQQLNLKTMLALHSFQWAVMTKFTLALMLSYSLFHLYGGPWAEEKWGRNNIVFFGNGKSYPLRPFLCLDPENLDGPLYDPEGFHRYPLLLELGVILLEIHIGQRLETFLGRTTDITGYDDLWLEASKTFREKRSDFISTSYRDAIEKCLKPDFALSATCDEQTLRCALLTDIVKPLEKEVERAFQEFLSIESLDEEAEAKISLCTHAGDNGKADSDPGSHDFSKGPQFISRRSTFQHTTNTHHQVPSMDTLSLADAGPLSREDFKIAIVCALPLEYDAVEILMDKFWDDQLYGRAVGDPNTYTFGRIGNYDVVLALLPSMGKVSAASGAASLRSSFPRLKLVLLTGICGGVPSPGTEDEMLLGDVVLSASVFQYDFGRLNSGGFVPKDTLEDRLGRPTKDIRSLLSSFRTERGRMKLEERATQFLEHLQDEDCRRRQRRKYQYPGASDDRLFESSYAHKHRGFTRNCCDTANGNVTNICRESSALSCEKLGCHSKHLVPRDRIDRKIQLEEKGLNLKAQAPSIFVGSIGSGDSVLKSGADRDRIAKQHDLIAFEMEGAGIWDEFACIVVKGICDYADSHKNKRWQNFAAATAASVMKALLEKYRHTDEG